MIGISHQGLNLRGLDILRGLLAVYVLFGHARWLLWAGHSAWSASPHAVWEIPISYAGALLRYGHEAVMVFFLLSGFFIHFKNAQRLGASEKVKNEVVRFFARRVHRLVPAYLFALLITVVLDAAGRSIYPPLYQGLVGDRLLDENFSKKGLGLANVLPALFFLPSAAGKDFGSNGPLWSLAYEVCYYLLYPIWLKLRLHSGFVAYGCIIFLFVSASVFPSIPFVSSVIWYYPLWILGAGLAEMVLAKKLRARAYFCLSLLLFPIAAGVSFQGGQLILNAIASAGLVLGFASMPPNLFRLQLLRLLEFFGIASYSVYIIHFPVLVLVSAVTFAMLGSRPLHGWMVVAGGLSALAFALGCFWICERHFLNRQPVRMRLPGDSASPDISA